MNILRNSEKMNKVKLTKLPSRFKTTSLMKVQKGIALLEALIAILIFSFGVLGIVGLQSAMVKGTTQSKFRSDASYIAERRISMMWANSANLAGFVEANTAVAELPGGTRTTTLVNAATGEVRVRVNWTVPGEPQHNYDVTAFITQAN